MVRARVVRVRAATPELAAAHTAAGETDQVPAWEATEDSGGSATQREQTTVLDLAVEQVEEVTPDTSRMVAVEGGVRLTVYGAGASPPFGCGDVMEMPLRMKAPERFRTPGAFRLRRVSAGEGDCGACQCRGGADCGGRPDGGGLEVPVVCGAGVGGGEAGRVCGVGRERAAAAGCCG